MKIGFVRIFVTDLQKSLEFYMQQLGLPLDFTDNAHWAQFHAGEDISLAIEKCDADKTEAGGKLVGRFVGVTLVVDDIQSKYEQLSANGIQFTSPPEKQPWGGILAHFRDLDGNVITIMESGD